MQQSHAQGLDLLGPEDLGVHARLGGEIGGAFDQGARREQVAGLVGQQPGGVDRLAHDQPALEQGALPVGDQDRGLTDAGQRLGGLEVAVIEVGQDDGFGRRRRRRLEVDRQADEVDGDRAIPAFARPQGPGSHGAPHVVGRERSRTGPDDDDATGLPTGLAGRGGQHPAEVRDRLAARQRRGDLLAHRPAQPAGGLIGVLCRPQRDEQVHGNVAGPGGDGAQRRQLERAVHDHWSRSAGDETP